MKENQKLPVIKTLSREYMNKRIAFFSEQKDLKWDCQIVNYLNAHEN